MLKSPNMIQRLSLATKHLRTSKKVVHALNIGETLKTWYVSTILYTDPILLPLNCSLEVPKVCMSNSRCKRMPAPPSIKIWANNKVTMNIQLFLSSVCSCPVTNTSQISQVYIQCITTVCSQPAVCHCFCVTDATNLHSISDMQLMILPILNEHLLYACEWKEFWKNCGNRSQMHSYPVEDISSPHLLITSSSSVLPSHYPHRSDLPPPCSFNCNTTIATSKATYICKAIWLFRVQIKESGSFPIIKWVS